MTAAEAYKSDCKLAKSLARLNDKPGTCRLCLRTEPLQLSHIHPAWLWRAVKSEGQFMFVDAGTGDSNKEQTELKEPLLCHDCEQRLSRHEGHVKQWYDTWLALERPRNVVNGKVVGKNIIIPRFAEVDYAHAKLFILACFWRADQCSFRSYRAVPDRDEDVLGPIIKSDHYRNRLRELILTDQPGEDYDFPILPNFDSSGLLANVNCLSVRSIMVKGRECLVTFAGMAEWTVVLEEGNREWTSMGVRRLQDNDRCYYEMEDFYHKPGYRELIDSCG